MGFMRLRLFPYVILQEPCKNLRVVQVLPWIMVSMMVLSSDALRNIRPFSQLFQSSLHQIPVLLFPGMGASRLVSATNAANIYPPPVADYLTQYSSWKQRMMFDKTLVTLPFGSPSSLDLKSVSRIFADCNKYDGILKEPTVHAMPYDFRRIDEETYLDTLFHDIKTYIESFHRPIAVVAHSTGGLLFHGFVHRQSPEWRAKWIQTVIHVNVPFGGVTTVLENCVFRDIHFIRLIGSDVFRSLGATVINMPNPRYVPHILNVDGDDVEDYLDYLQLYDIKHRLHQPHVQALIATFSQSTGIDTHIVHSDVRCRDRRSLTTTGIRINLSTGKYTRIYGDGDGVVSMDSLLVPKQWTPTTGVTFHPIPGMGHSSLLA